MNRAPSREYLYPAAALALAAVLLFIDLGGKDFWSDEIFSIPKVRRVDIVLAQSAWDVHPPLFFILEYYWTGIFGSSESAARAMSSLFGLGAILVSFLLAGRIIPRQNRMCYLLVLSTSPFLLFYARMNRYYALTGLLCLLALYFYLRMKERPALKREIPFWAVSLLLIYEDYVGFILLLSLTVDYFIRCRKQPRQILRFIAGGVSILILYLPWMSNLLHQTARGAAPYPEAGGAEDFRLGGWILYNGAQSLIRAGYTLFNFTLGETVFPWNPLILTGAGGAAILFSASLKNKRIAGGLWFFALILPFMIYIFAAVFYSRVFSASNFALIPSKIFFLQPLWLMFLFRGGEGKLRWVRAGFLLLLLFNGLSLVNYHRGAQFLNPKYVAPWGRIAEEISVEAEKADMVITDESCLLRHLRVMKVESHGLVDAERHIEERPAPFKVNLALRHRGEESIYREGVKLKQILEEKYPQAGYKGYVRLEGMQKLLWNKLLGEEFEYYIEIFIFQVL